MQTGAQRKREPDGPPTQRAAKAQIYSFVDSAETVELPPHGRLPRLDLGIDWESPWREFRTSVGWFFTGERPPKDSKLANNSHLRIHWIGGRNSGWAFAASSVWHAIVVVLLVLPIWGFLPATARNLAPIRVELSISAPEDLPQIHLGAASQPAPRSARTAVPAPPLDATKPPAPDGADAFHPRQTILSIPVRITHPRQTLIQPAAPMSPPKIEPELPNVVQWAASAPPVPKLQLQLAPSAAAPKMRERAVDDAVAPDVANAEKNVGPLNIAASPVVNPAPQMPMMPMGSAVAATRHMQTETDGAAPELGAQNGDAGLRNVIALSASPAPPTPEIAVPQGNLAARIAISPSGTQRGLPGGTGTNGSGSAGGGSANGNGVGVSAGTGTGTGGSASGTLPAAVSISGGSSHASVAGGGGLAAGQSRSKLILKPTSSLAKPEMNPRKGPANVADLGPNDPPEKILSGKEVYKLDINLPNLTSASGSWILNFAELDEGTTPFNRPKGVLSGPVPMVTVDPKYPPDAIKENIEGEVVLYAIIRADGSVDSIQLVRRLDPRLDRNAVEALAQWKFRPATREGKPIDIEAVVHVPFQHHAPAP